LFANVITCNGGEQLSSLGELRARGIPQGGAKAKRAFVTNFGDWTTVPTARYTDVFDELTGASSSHAVYAFRQGGCEYLVPALVLLRGLFPLIPDGFEYAFFPRGLEVLCLPVGRNGHWSVVLPNFTGVYRARFRRPTVEALSWASLFPSGKRAWRSVYAHASLGKVDVDLPDASVSVLVYGHRIGRTVRVTELIVNALEVHEAPFAYVSSVATSFTFNWLSTPLTATPNAFFEQVDTQHKHAHLKLSDEEWEAVRKYVEVVPPSRGRIPRDGARDVADGLLVRALTNCPWQDIPVPISGEALTQHWRRWREDGRWVRLYEKVDRLRSGKEWQKTQ